MKKRKRFLTGDESSLFRRIVKIMKLTTFILLASTMMVSASLYSQSTKVTLKFREISFAELFQEIESQTEFRFAFSSSKLDPNQKVRIDMEKKTLEEILDKTLPEGIAYEIIDRYVVIMNASEKTLTVASQQQKSVSGKVTDESDQPLPGVTVIIKGTTQGMVTNNDGNYSITNIPDNATLVFSFVGMRPQEVVVGNQTNINITMVVDAIGLEEVVAVGYGTARRRDISGAVSTVRLEDSPVSLSPNTNPLQSLQGGVAGVNIEAQNSVGTTPDIIIRGQNSISGSNTPLIVLDGIIYIGSISDINPEDIAVLDVLKDASAAAVYGSRAANGVIVITTKKGKSDKPVISYNTYLGIHTWPSPPNVMNYDRWTEKYIAQNPSINSIEEMVFDDVARMKLWEQRIDVNWMDLISRNGLVQNHQLAVSGQANRLNYYFSGGFTSHEGPILGDDYDRISVRSKLDANITEWLEVGLDGIYNNNNYSGAQASIGSALSITPFSPPYRWDSMPLNYESNTGKLLERWPMGQSITSPLWDTNKEVREDVDVRSFYQLATYALFKVPKVVGLTYRLNFSINSNNDVRESFLHEGYYIGMQNKQPFINRYFPSEVAKLLSQANGYNNRTNTFSYVLDNIVNYKNSFGAHYVDVTLVATRDYRYSKLVGASGNDYVLNGNTLLGVDGIHKATVQKINLNVVETANIGYLGRISYAYLDKYHLTASMRRDGASVFGAKQKWGNFPSVGVAWTISEEGFMSGSDKLNYLKIKASYGKNGNQGLSPYQTLARVASGSDGGIRYEFGDAPSTILYGVAQTSLGSPSLGWETTTAFNGGFQSSWLNDRIFLDLDFYKSKTTDQIFLRQIPIMTGFNTIYSSLGQINNSGVEISLRTDNIKSENLKWSSNLLFWQNRNKIQSLYGDDIDGDGIEDDDIANSLFIGKSLSAIYGFEFIGVVQEDDTEYIAKVGAQPGDPMFRDISGPDGTPDGKITADYDRKILGYRKENFRMSLSNTVDYKNLSLYVMVTGIFGGGKDNYYLLDNARATRFGSEFWPNEIDHDWWTPENKSEKYLRPDYLDNTRYLGLQSRGFVKIQDVNLSYKLPKGVFGTIGLNSMEIYASIKNLYTFTNWFGGGDPERGIRANEGTNPVPRTYTMGFKVSF